MKLITSKNILVAVLTLLGIVLLYKGWVFWRGPSTKPMGHSANHSPLYDPHDKLMTIQMKAVDVATGKVVSINGMIHESKSRTNQMKQAVLAFLSGPRTGALQVPVPEGMELNEFFITPQGMAVVDLSLAQVAQGKFGFYEECLFIRGVIEVLTANFYEVKQVKVLVDGQDATTLGGHYALGTYDVSLPQAASAGAN